MRRHAEVSGGVSASGAGRRKDVRRASEKSAVGSADLA
jgi:hypothetical protein